MLELNKIYNMDCIEGMKQLEDNSVDSIVTDPPYELGFMGKSWDASGIAYNVEMWKEAFRVLKPGGHLLSFGGTRTYHRMASAIEDAGFEIRDQIMWVYGSGFPKSLNIGKAVDKLQGNEREVVGKGLHSNIHSFVDKTKYSGTDFKPDITKGNSQWEGWGTALKPAHEPIVVARKPLAEKTVAENVLKYGTGGINIDECRIPTNENRNREQKEGPLSSKYGFNNNSMGNRFVELSPIGRFPANVIHDGSDEVVSLFPNENGSAARFFYCAKASKSERNAGLEGKFNTHPTIKPLKLMQYLVRLVTPKNGIVLDPFMGSGTTGMAAKSQGFNYIGFDMTKEYVEIAEARIKAIEYQKKLLEE